MIRFFFRFFGASAAALLCMALLSGTFVSCSSNDSSSEYLYRLRVPDSYDGLTSCPLIIAMHGYGDTGANFESNSRLTPVATDAGYLIAYPQSLRAGWNSGGAYFSGPTYGDDDISYILGIIDEISENYRIDDSRIYLTGHSNGAFMAYHLAASVPSRFAAIAPVAGTMMVTDIGGATPVSILHIHGLSDASVPYEGMYYFPPVESALSLWREKNGCGAAIVSTTQSYTRRDWAGSAADISVYEVNGLGHTWPTFASTLIVDFFSEHALQTIPETAETVDSL